MTTARPEVDPAVLRVVLQRLNELDAEAHGVTDTVLDHLPSVDAGVAAPTISDVGNGLIDAFTTLAESLGETERLVSSAGQRRVVIDLTAVEAFDRAVR
jgi:hypothetical protein